MSILCNEIKEIIDINKNPDKVKEKMKESDKWEQFI